MNTSVYMYKNQTSSSITIKAHSYFLKKDSVLIISPGGMLELIFGIEHEVLFPPPFSWDECPPYTDDYIVVSNGEKQLIHKFYPPAPETNNLYQEETYTFVNEKKRHRTYQYIFTDADFENAEPIEPSEDSE